MFFLRFGNGHFRNVVLTFTNVLKLDVENGNVDSTFFDVVNSNVDLTLSYVAAFVSAKRQC